jgi:hypothetical protein
MLPCQKRVQFARPHPRMLDAQRDQGLCDQVTYRVRPPIRRVCAIGESAASLRLIAPQSFVGGLAAYAEGLAYLGHDCLPA